MANANLSLVQLANTFDQWRIQTNNLANTVNELRNGNFYKDNGNFTLPNGAIVITVTSGTGLSVLNNVLFSALTTMNTSIHTGLASFLDNVTMSGVNSSVTAANVVKAPIFVSDNTLFGNGVFKLTGANTGNGIFIAVLNANTIVNIANNIFMSNTGNVEIKGALNLTLASGLALNVAANSTLSGNLTVSKNTVISQNANVAGTMNVVGTILGINEILSGTANIATANIGTESVTGVLTLTSSTVANSVVAATSNIGANGITVTNDVVVAGNTKLNVGNVATLNTATANVSGTLNAVGIIYGANEILSGTLNVATTINTAAIVVSGTANIATSNVANETVTGTLTLTPSTVANGIVAATSNIGANGITVTKDLVVGQTTTLNNVNAGNTTTANLTVSATSTVLNETVSGTLTASASTVANAIVAASGNVGANGVTVTNDLKVGKVSTLNNVTAGNLTTANANVSAVLNVSVLQVGGNITAYNVFLDTTNTYQIIAGNATFNNLIVRGTQTVVGNTVSASDTLLLRNTLATAGDGHLTVAQGGTNGNADLRFLQTANVWQTSANTANGYTTVITTANVVDVINSTSLVNAGAANAVKTAYDQATSAYTQANSARTQANSAYAQANASGIYANGTVTLANAANVNFNNTATVNVSSTANGVTQANVAFSINLSALSSINNYQADVLANGTVSLANANLNFNNTATVNVAVQANGTTQANITFSANGTALGIPAVNTALGTMNGNFGTINTTFGTTNTTFGTINTTFATENTTFGTLNTNITVASSQVASYANGTAVLAAANLNWNNTATMNVSVTANGTGQANIAWSANGTALGVPAINTALGTMNANFGGINTALAAGNTNFGAINSTFATVNTEIVNLNAAAATINTSLATHNTTFGTVNSTFAAYNSAFTTSQLVVNGTANVTGNVTLTGVVGMNTVNGIISTSGTASGTGAQIARVLLPGGGAFSNISALANGAFRIALPSAINNNTMIRMELKIFENFSSANENGDSAGSSRIIYTGGYIKTDNTWSATFQTEETQAASALNIRYGKDSANNPLIWIGEFGSSNTQWISPQIHISEVEAGYNGASAAALANGWAITQTDSQGSDTVTNGPFHVSQNFNEFTIPLTTMFSTLNTTFGTMNTSLATHNTTFATHNTTFGTVNTSLATMNTNISIAGNVRVFVGGVSTGNTVNGNINFTSANSSNIVISGTLNTSPGNVTINFDTRLPPGGGGGGSPTVNNVAVTYTFQVTDDANAIYHNSGSAHTFTMAAHSTIALNTGATIVVVNQAAGGNVVLANAATVKFIFAGTSLFGNRNLVANGMATLFQIAQDTWIISGVGVS